MLASPIDTLHKFWLSISGCMRVRLRMYLVAEHDLLLVPGGSRVNLQKGSSTTEMEPVTK